MIKDRKRVSSSNTPAVMRIQQPGLLSTLQDFGRYGHQAEGITQGGPIDERAFLWGNKLLGQGYNCAQIEITMGHFKAQFLRHTLFVLCGADFKLSLNGEICASWRVHEAKAGDVLEVKAQSQGLRIYLAVAGGFDADPRYGSVATVMRDKLGGLEGDGKPLQANDVLTGGGTSPRTILTRRPQSELLTTSTNEVSDVAFLPCAQYQDFSETERDRFLQQSYTVTPAFDRMGVRLKGEQAVTWPHAQMISEPLANGSIQIPPDGQPIVMLNDHQTLGGYPKIGVLTWHGRCTLAQCEPGRRIRFVPQDLKEAQRAIRRAYRFFNVMS